MTGWMNARKHGSTVGIRIEHLLDHPLHRSSESQPQSQSAADSLPLAARRGAPIYLSFGLTDGRKGRPTSELTNWLSLCANSEERARGRSKVMISSLFASALQLMCLLLSLCLSFPVVRLLLRSFGWASM